MVVRVNYARAIRRDARARRDAAIVASYLAGERQVDIAARFGLTQPAISTVIRQNNVAARAGRPPLPLASREDRLAYMKLRVVLGWPAARKAMGL